MKTKCRKHTWEFKATYGHPKGSNYGQEVFYKCTSCNATGKQNVPRDKSAGRIVKIR